MNNLKIQVYKSSLFRIESSEKNPNAPKLYIETYGCQMNVSDSEVVLSVMLENGFTITENYKEADVILINTCAVRDNAEQRIRNRLMEINALKKKKKHLIVGLLGCMAERLKQKLVEEEKVLDIVAGPDSYRSLPLLVKEVEHGSKAINVLLSREETYADISPVRKDKNNVSAFISITRGCDNMCAFCVVPFTRGRERSRDPQTIIREVNEVIFEGYKEITLLGQNVDKYNWNNGEMNFAELLKLTADINPNIRIRFATSYPQDFNDEVIRVMSEHKNICKYIHLPVQSGSNNMLEKMKRGYDRNWYLDRIKAIRNVLPDCSISTDLITGFSGETEQDHLDTLDLMKAVGFDFAYMFKYSERPGTFAARNYKDDVDEDIKIRRLNEVIEMQQKLSLESNKKDIGKIFDVLIEGFSKKSDKQYFGRNSQNKVVVFHKENSNIGDYVKVKITSCTPATLLGEIVN